MKEIWKQIEDTGYKVSNFGNVIGISGRLLKPQLSHKGYYRVQLHGKQQRVHRLVACQFVDNPNGYVEINHINGIKTDNRVENLEWCSRSHNMSSIRSRARQQRYKRVYQYTDDGRLVNVYRGVVEAARMMNVNRSSITDSCFGRLKKVGGYMWRFSNDDNQLSLDL